MSDARTGANEPDTPQTAPTVFDRFLKEHALKILLDYSASTGRKWPTITDEIVQHAIRTHLERVPSLARSSLEHWASGRKGIGNDKFRLVYHFLTHPDTLARPELAHASILKEPLHGLLRAGRVISQFYTDFSYAWRLSPRFFDADLVREVNNRLSGIYVGVYQRRHICLSLELIDDEGFYVAHFLTSADDFEKRDVDWKITRHSGYVTVGVTYLAHLKSMIDKRPRALWIFPPKDIIRVNNIQIITDEIKHNSVLSVLNNGNLNNNKLPFINPLDYTFTLQRTNSIKMKELISAIRWRIPS